MWQSGNFDLEELVRQFLDLKRTSDDLRQRVERLEDEVIILADRSQYDLE